MMIVVVTLKASKEKVVVYNILSANSLDCKFCGTFNSRTQ